MAPEWAVDLFVAVNGLIALTYGLLAIFFAMRIKLPPKGEAHPLSLLACIAAGLFFLGCAHTHLELTTGALTGDLREHWYSWWNILSHTLQGLGGITFWILATFYLRINIYDRRHYEKTQKEVFENGRD